MTIYRNSNKIQVLEKRLVFVPAEKVANNGMVIILKYYMRVLNNDIILYTTKVNSKFYLYVSRYI